MIPYITFREMDEEGRLCFFILQKAFPNYIGLLVSSPREGGIVNAPIPKYRLWITYAGVLSGNFFPGHSGALQEVQQVFNSMSEWYYICLLYTSDAADERSS